MTPQQISGLTDFQILELYLLPAVERSRQTESKLAQIQDKLPSPGRQWGTPPTATVTPPAAPPPRGMSDKIGDPNYYGPDGEPGTPIHRKQCIWAYMSVMGMSQEQAERCYDRQLAEYLSQQQQQGGEQK